MGLHSTTKALNMANLETSTSQLLDSFLALEARRLDVATTLALAEAARRRAEEAARKAEAKARQAEARALTAALRTAHAERKRANHLAHDDFIAARRLRRARSKGIPV